MFWKVGKRICIGNKFSILFGLILLGFINLFSVNGVYATIKGDDKLHKIAVLQGVRECYYKYAQATVSNPNPSIQNIFEWDNAEFSKTNSDDIWIPTHVGNTLSGDNESDSNVSCRQVFAGYDNKVIGLFGKNDDLNGGFYSMSGLDSYDKYGYKTTTVTAGDVGSTKFVRFGGDSSKNVIIDGQPFGVSASGEIICSGVLAGNGNVANVKCNDGEIDIGVKGNTFKLTSKNSFFKLDNENITMQIALSSDYVNSSFDSLSKVFTTSGAIHPSSDGSTVAFFDYVMGKIDDKVKEKLGGETGCWEKGCYIKIEDYNVTTGYEQIRQKNDNGNISRVPKVSASELLKNLGIDTNLPTKETTAKNLVNVGGGELKYTRYIWSNSFIYSLYYYYLYNLSTEKGGGKIYLGGKGMCQETKGEGYWFRNTLEHSSEKPKWCKINGYEDYLGDTYSVYDKESGLLKKGNFTQVLEWLSDDSEKGSYEGLAQDDYANLGKDGDEYLVFATGAVEQPTTTDQGENASGTAAATCQSSGGAGAVGWIVCPILEWMGNSATHLYTDYVEPRLKINPKLFQTLESGNSNPTQNAWGTFQTIANVVFIILLLVVIFSQLTGIGIDNYGIKRILPKLIVVAILVNLSYLICVICVDLSNILGGSLKGLFDSLGASLGDIEVNTGVASTSALGNDSWIPVVLFGILVTFIIVGAASIVFNPAILLTLLISGLGVVISVLFIFVLFAVREAAIVVLTVVAPIAFVCYALPNTKKMFDKWLKAWEGLLLVYPICGLLIGGGDYISRLLITVEGAGTNETGFFPLMTAMVVGIAPIFFIPTLLKGSFAAMGNIGAKVSGIGKNLSGRATKAATNSEINKNAQRMGAERRNRIRAGLDQNGELTGRAQRRIERTRRRAGSNIPLIGGMIRGAARGQAKAQASRIAAAKKDFSVGESANAMLMGALATARMSEAMRGTEDKSVNPREYFSGLLEEAASRGTSEFDAALTAAADSGYFKPKEIAGMVRDMSNAGKLDKEKYDANWWRRAANKHNAVMSTDFEMLSWARAGGAAGTGQQLGGYGDFASATDANGRSFINVDDIKQDDISKMSGDSLAGMLAAGKINKGMAQQMLVNGAGLTQDKRVMLGAVASGAATAESIVGAGGSDSVSDGASVYKNESKALMSNAGASTWNDNGTNRQIQSIHTENTNNAGWTGEVASTAEVEGWMAPQAQEVVIRGQGESTGRQSSLPTRPGEVLNVQHDMSRLSNETVLDVAINPNVANNDPYRMAAVQEYERRNPGYSNESGEGGRAAGPGRGAEAGRENTPSRPNIPPVNPPSGNNRA